MSKSFCAHCGLELLPGTVTGDSPMHDVCAPFECPRHGGTWGDDETCELCTDEDGNTRPRRESGE